MTERMIFGRIIYICFTFEEYSSSMLVMTCRFVAAVEAGHDGEEESGGGQGEGEGEVESSGTSVTCCTCGCGNGFSGSY